LFGTARERETPDLGAGLAEPCSDVDPVRGPDKAAASAHIITSRKGFRRIAFVTSRSLQARGLVIKARLRQRRVLRLAFA